MKIKSYDNARLQIIYIIKYLIDINDKHIYTIKVMQWYNNNNWIEIRVTMIRKCTQRHEEIDRKEKLLDNNIIHKTFQFQKRIKKRKEDRQHKKKITK